MDWLKKKWVELSLGALLTCLLGCGTAWATGIIDLIKEAKNKSEELQKEINDRPKKCEVDGQFVSLLNFVNQQDDAIKITIAENKKDNIQQQFDMEQRFFKYIEQILKSNEMIQQDVRDLKLYILNERNKQKSINYLKDKKILVDSLLYMHNDLNLQVLKQK